VKRIQLGKAQSIWIWVSTALLAVFAVMSQSSAQSPKATRTAPPTSQKTTAVPTPPQPAAAAREVQPPAPSYRFPTGQTLTFLAQWRLFDAGTGSLRMETAGREQRVIAVADAIGAIGLLYHVQDRIETSLDPATFCALTLHKHTEEGLRRLETNVTFDQTRNKSVLAEKNLRNNESKQVENDTPGCVEDVLSAVYYVGSLPLTAGSAYHFPMNDGGKTTEVKVTVEAREDVKVPAGAFKAIRVQPTAESGLIKNRGQIWVWYSDDASHIPVQVKARLFWGTLLFQLQKVEYAGGTQPQR